MSLIGDAVLAIRTSLPGWKTLDTVLKFIDARIKEKTGVSFSEYGPAIKAGAALALKGRAMIAHGAAAAAAALVKGVAAVQVLMQKSDESMSDWTRRGVDTLD